MYDDFYGYDVIEVYVYECEICKTTVKSSTIHECLVCKKRLCTNLGCNMGGFCTNHYNLLSVEGKEELKKILYEQKQHLKLYKNVLYGFLGLIGLIYTFLCISFFASIRIERFEYVYDWELIMNLTFLGIGLFIWAIIVILIYGFAVSQKVKHDDIEKLKIFSKLSKLI